jgi:hypothetical protein
MQAAENWRRLNAITVSELVPMWTTRNLDLGRLREVVGGGKRLAAKKGKAACPRIFGVRFALPLNQH